MTSAAEVTDPGRRHVRAQLEVEVAQSLDAVLKVAASDQPGVALNERLTITLDGEPMTAAEVIIPGEGRSHVLTVRPGLLSVDYQATIDGKTYSYAVRESTVAGLADQARALNVKASGYAQVDVWSVVYRARGFVGAVTMVGPTATLRGVKTLAGQAYSHAEQSLS